MIYITRQNDKLYTSTVVGCLCSYNGKYLFLQRNESKRYPLYWCVPGGKIDAAEETAVKGMLRELSEETGISLEAERLSYLYTYYVEDNEGCFVYLLYKIDFDCLPQITLNPEEHVNYIWQPLEEIARLDLVSDMREILNHSNRLLTTQSQLELFVPKHDNVKIAISPEISQLRQEKQWYASFGPPSSGKTTTLKEIVALGYGYEIVNHSKKILNINTRLNLYLRKAFEEKERRFFFNFQMEVLALRFLQAYDCLDKSLVDESIYSTLAYSIALRKLNWLTEDEFQTFMCNYSIYERLLPPPAKILHFKCDLELIHKRKDIRNRQIEKHYPTEYFEALFSAFIETAFILTKKYIVKSIDTTNLTPKEACMVCYEYIL